jgi:hypothetical protein
MFFSPLCPSRMCMFFKHVAMKERDKISSLSHGSMDMFTVALLAMEAC